MPITKQEKLKNEILKLYDTGKSRIIKKYNLSLYDIQTIEELLKKQNKYFIQGNVAKALKDYGYIVKSYGIGFELEVLDNDKRTKRSDRKFKRNK